MWQTAVLMPYIRMSAAQAAAGQLPPVCPRHGEDAVARRYLQLNSKPPPWAPVLLLAGFLPYLVVVQALRRTLDVRAWPWCARCTASRRARLVAGFSVLAAGVLLGAYGLVLDADTAWVVLCFGALVILVGIFVASFGNTVVVTGASVSRDGQFVEVPKGSRRYLDTQGSVIQSSY
jgi:hypothetical protein